MADPNSFTGNGTIMSIDEINKREKLRNQQRASTRFNASSDYISDALAVVDRDPSQATPETYKDINRTADDLENRAVTDAGLSDKPRVSRLETHRTEGEQVEGGEDKLTKVTTKHITPTNPYAPEMVRTFEEAGQPLNEYQVGILQQIGNIKRPKFRAPVANLNPNMERLKAWETQNNIRRGKVPVVKRGIYDDISGSTGRRSTVGDASGSITYSPRQIGAIATKINNIIQDPTNAAPISQSEYIAIEPQLLENPTGIDFVNKKRTQENSVLEDLKASAPAFKNYDDVNNFIAKYADNPMVSSFATNQAMTAIDNPNVKNALTKGQTSKDVAKASATAFVTKVNTNAAAFGSFLFDAFEMNATQQKQFIQDVKNKDPMALSRYDQWEEGSAHWSAEADSSGKITTKYVTPNTEAQKNLKREAIVQRITSGTIDPEDPDQAKIFKANGVSDNTMEAWRSITRGELETEYKLPDGVSAAQIPSNINISELTSGVIEKLASDSSDIKSAINSAADSIEGVNDAGKLVLKNMIARSVSDHIKDLSIQGAADTIRQQSLANMRSTLVYIDSVAQSINPTVEGADPNLSVRYDVAHKGIEGAAIAYLLGGNVLPSAGLNKTVGRLHITDDVEYTKVEELLSNMGSMGSDEDRRRLGPIYDVYLKGIQVMEVSSEAREAEVFEETQDIINFADQVGQLKDKAEPGEPEIEYKVNVDDQTINTIRYGKPISYQYIKTGDGKYEIFNISSKPEDAEYDKSIVKAFRNMTDDEDIKFAKHAVGGFKSGVFNNTFRDKKRGRFVTGILAGSDSDFREITGSEEAGRKLTEYMNLAGESWAKKDAAQKSGKKADSKDIKNIGLPDVYKDMIGDDDAIRIALGKYTKDGDPRYYRIALGLAHQAKKNYEKASYGLTETRIQAEAVTSSMMTGLVKRDEGGGLADYKGRPINKLTPGVMRKLSDEAVKDFEDDPDLRRTMYENVDFIRASETNIKSDLKGDTPSLKSITEELKSINENQVLTFQQKQDFENMSRFNFNIGRIAFFYAQHLEYSGPGGFFGKG